MKSKKPPNFLICGSSASGTSFLSSILLQHPEIYLPLPMRPEPHFFYKSWEYSKGWEYYLERWFSSVPDSAVAIGERSSSYMFGEEITAGLIRHHIPRARLVFILRNPIERTWANYRYTVLQGLENLGFMEALLRESERVKSANGVWTEIQPHNYTGRGFYARQLRAFLRFFPENQLHVIKSEELSKSTDLVLKSLFSFLGLSDSGWSYERPVDFTSMNVIDPERQVELRGYFAERFDGVIEAVRLRQDLATLAISHDDEVKLRQLDANLCTDKFEMPAEARSYLSRIFEADLGMLKELVSFDFSDWN